MLTPGTRLADRYEIIGRIGAGGMSDVYKALDQKLNRYVACKVLKVDFSKDYKFVQKFRAEAQAAAGLSHPNIVNVFDVGEENGIHFIIMELVQGITLKKYIERKGMLDIKEALNISVQIASGMGAAHANRIIHRDIKPQNVIMSRDGKVKVTDFGIARAADSTTVTTNAAGSVHYISPEQARGGYSDEKSDIYSLGITMYEMVTGRVPYDGENNVAVALQHIQAAMIPPREFNPECPISFEKVILKCTQKKPDLRYTSAKELILDLRRVLAEPDGNYVTLAGMASTTPENRTAAVDGAAAYASNRTSRLTPEEKKRKALQEEIEEYKEYEDPYAGRRKKKKQPRREEIIEEDEDEGSGLLDKLMMGIGVIGMLLIIGLALFFGLRAMGKLGGQVDNKKESQTSAVSTESAMAEVPDVTNLAQEEAVALLEKAGLDYTIREKETSDHNPGLVLDQSPSAGTSLEKGAKVTITVSVSSEKVTMPDVVSMYKDDAQTTLESMGLKVRFKNEFNDEYDEDRVISSSPEAGKEVKVGATVTLTVSKGKKDENVTVPDLSGMTYNEAVNAIKTAKLTVGSVSEEYSDYVTEGYVTWQGIDAGSEVAEGTEINFGVSKGKESGGGETGTATVYLPSDSPFGHDLGGGAPLNAGTITMIVTYEDGSSTTVYSGYETADSYTPGQGVTITGPSGESASVICYVDDFPFSSSTVTFN